MSSNYNRSLERALEIIEAAAKSGAHALKIQTLVAVEYLMINKLFRPVDRNDNSMSGIRFYAMSVFSLVSVASLMAINAMDLYDFVRILAACAALIGMYSLFFRIFERHDFSVLAFIGSLIVLPSLPYISYVAYLVGVLGWIVLIRHEWKVDKNTLLFLPVLFVAIFGSGIYSDFQYQNSLTMGAIHLDTFFHAAIAAMYSHYGVASIGLDGLVPIAYHTLSHKIMAGVAILSGFETLAVYSYLFFAMGPLLLAFSLAGFACQLNSKLKFNQALLGTSLLMLAITSVPIFGRAAMWDSYFVSESYLIALVILTVSLATLISWVEGGAVGMIQLATSLSLLILAGLAKGGVGMVGICVFGLLGITKFRFFRYWMLLAVASVLMYFGVIDAATNAKQLNPINLFHFVTTYTKPLFFATTTWGKVVFFLAVHFLPVWVCFVIGLRKLGSEYFKTIEFQVLLALLIPALFFSLTFEIAGGSAYYFSSIPVIVSLPFLLPSLSYWLNIIKFKHVVGFLILASLIVYPIILNRSFIRDFQENKADFDALQIVVKQLHDIRDNSPINLLVKIENPEELIGKIGCNAYWFLPAVMERPLIDGLPNKDLCPSVSNGFYGLSDYHANEKKLISEDFKVVRVRIGQ